MLAHLCYVPAHKTFVEWLLANKILHNRIGTENQYFTHHVCLSMMVVNTGRHYLKDKVFLVPNDVKWLNKSSYNRANYWWRFIWFVNSPLIVWYTVYYVLQVYFWLLNKLKTKPQASNSYGGFFSMLHEICMGYGGGILLFLH